MSEQTTEPRQAPHDAVRLAAWAVFAPVLVLWSVLSTLAGLSLLLPGQSLAFHVVQLLLFVSGFWGIFAGWLFVRFTRSADVVEAPVPDMRGRILAVGTYASVWTVVYVIAAFAGT